MLLGLSVILGVAYTALYCAMVVVQVKRRVRRPAEGRFVRVLFTGMMSATPSSLLGRGVGGGLDQEPSGLLAKIIVGAGMTTLFGVAVLEFRRGWLIARAERRARTR